MLPDDNSQPQNQQPQQPQMSQAKNSVEYRNLWLQYYQRKWQGNPNNQPQQQSRFPTFGQQQQQQQGAGYWEDPENLRRYHTYIQSAPPGWQAPSWMDVQQIEDGYKYYAQKNQNKNWWEWTAPDVNDPVRTSLRNLPTPPVEDWFPDQQQAAAQTQTQAQTQAQADTGVYRIPTSKMSELGADITQFEQYKNGEYYDIPGWVLNNSANPNAPTYDPTQPDVKLNQYGIPKENWAKLPGWQKAVIPVLPAINTAIAVGGTTLAGFGMGGPIGAAIGSLAGSGLGYLSSPDETGKPRSQTITDLMMKLDIPAEHLERTMGYLVQLEGAAIDPEKYGDITQLLFNEQQRQAAWRAGHLTYDVTFSRKGPNGEVIYSELGNPEEQKWSAPGGGDPAFYALTEARKRIAGIESEEERTKILDEIGAQFGFGGQMKDLLGHMLLDPIDKIMDVSGKLIGSPIAGLAGNEKLATSFADTHDVVSALRDYGQKLRYETPVAEAAQYGGISKWLAGLNAEGMPTELANGRGPLDYLRGLDPKSRATYLLTHASEGLTSLLSQADDPRKMMSMYEAMRAVTPDDAELIFEKADMPGQTRPKWFESGEGRVVSEALSSADKPAKEMIEAWELSRRDADVLQRISDYMERDPYDLMKELRDATPEEAKKLFITFKDKVKSAAAGDAQAAKVMESLSGNDLVKLDGAMLKQIAGKFVGENGLPFGSQEWAAKFSHMLTDHLEKWTVNRFNVKPKGWALRLNGVVKRAQSIALLGLNPNLFVNNAINNLVTLGWDGLLRYSTSKDRNAWLKRFGVEPARIHTGMNAAEVGGTTFGEFGKELRAAGRADDWIQHLDDFVKKGDRVAVFAKLSSNFEKWCSELAMVNSMRDYWSRYWVEGKGFIGMDAPLRESLNAFGETHGIRNLADKVSKKISAGLSRQEIEKNVFKNLLTFSLHDVMKPDEKALINGHFPELFTILEDRISRVKTADEIRTAFRDIRKDMATRANDSIRQNIQTIVQTATRQSSDAQGFLDMMDGILHDQADFDSAHFERMARVAEQVAETSPDDHGLRRALWRNALREEDEAYQNFRVVQAAKWRGAYDGLGADTETARFLLWLHGGGEIGDKLGFDDVKSFREIWDGFYEARRQVYERYGGMNEFKRKDNEEMTLELNKLYRDSVISEDRTQSVLDEVFADLYVKQVDSQGGDIVGAKVAADKWREAIRLKRQEQANVMYYFRTWGDDIRSANEFWTPIPDEIRQQIDEITFNSANSQERSMRFYDEVYTPYIGKKVAASHENAIGTPIVEPAPGPEAVPTPTPEAKAPPPSPEVEPEQIKPAPAPEPEKPKQEAAMSPEPEATTPSESIAVAPPQPTIPPAGPKSLKFLRTVADLYSLPQDNVSLNGLGNFVLNVVRKYYSDKFEHLGQVSEQVIKDAFRTRQEQYKAINTNMEAQHAVDKRMMEYRAKVVSKNLDNLTLPGPRITTEEIISKIAQDHFYQYRLKEAGNDPETAAKLAAEDYEASMEIMNVVDTIAKDNNTTKEEMLKRLVFTYGGVEGGDEALGNYERGITRWLGDGKALIHLYETADTVTFRHEFIHYVTPYLNPADLKTIQVWVKGAYNIDLPQGWQADWKNNKQTFELLARAHEVYDLVGRAPTPTLARVFEKIKRIALQVYDRLQGTKPELKLNDDMRSMFDRWHGKEGAAPAAAPITEAAPSPDVKIVMRPRYTYGGKAYPEYGLWDGGDKIHTRSDSYDFSDEWKVVDWKKTEEIISLAEGKGKLSHIKIAANTLTDLTNNLTEIVEKGKARVEAKAQEIAKGEALQERINNAAANGYGVKPDSLKPGDKLQWVDGERTGIFVSKMENGDIVLQDPTRPNEAPTVEHPDLWKVIKPKRTLESFPTREEFYSDASVRHLREFEKRNEYLKMIVNAYKNGEISAEDADTLNGGKISDILKTGINSAKLTLEQYKAKYRPANENEAIIGYRHSIRQAIEGNKLTIEEAADLINGQLAEHPELDGTLIDYQRKTMTWPTLDEFISDNPDLQDPLGAYRNMIADGMEKGELGFEEGKLLVGTGYARRIALIIAERDAHLFSLEEFRNHLHGIGAGMDIETLIRKHGYLVKQALIDGKKVTAKVVKDYPDLVLQYNIKLDDTPVEIPPITPKTEPITIPPEPQQPQAAAPGPKQIDIFGNELPIKKEKPQVFSESPEESPRPTLFDMPADLKKPKGKKGQTATTATPEATPPAPVGMTQADIDEIKAGFTELLIDVNKENAIHDAISAIRQEIYKAMSDNPDLSREELVARLPGVEQFKDLLGMDTINGVIDDQIRCFGTPITAPIKAEVKPIIRFMTTIADQLAAGDLPFQHPRDFENYAQTELGLDMNDEKNLNYAYDALEGAFNLQARRIRATMTDAPIVDRIKAMADLEERLIRARRTISKMKLQQFSTPLSISEAAGYVANVRPGDVILEPTAGTGNLVDMHFGKPDVDIQVNEFDEMRRNVLDGIGYQSTGTDVLGEEWVIKNGRLVEPDATVIITNPPWGSYSTGKYGKPANIPVEMNDRSQRFTYLTLSHLAEGGRFVGVMPQNWLYTVDRVTRGITVSKSKFLQWMEKAYDVRGIIESPPDAYKARGTNVGSLLVIIDKHKAKSPIQIQAWGKYAPKDWETYSKLVEEFGRGQFARSADDVRTSQDAARKFIQRPASGPDATGLVDPNATSGRPTADVDNIGKPAPKPDRSKLFTDRTARIEPDGTVTTASGRGEPGTQPGLTPGTEPRTNQPGAEPGARAEQPGTEPGPGTRPEQPTEQPGRIPDTGRTEPETARPAMGEPTKETAGGPGVGGNDNTTGGTSKLVEPSGKPTNEGGDISPRNVEGKSKDVQSNIQRYAAEPLRAREEIQPPINAEQKEVIDRGVFVQYGPRAPLTGVDQVRHHSTLLVEAKSLAGITYPDLLPEHRPTASVMKAYERGAISLEANLDAVWAAVQQNDKYHSGILVADDVGIGKSRTAAAFVIDRLERGHKRILVVTKGSDNVINLKDTEFPGVYNGEVSETGSWLRETYHDFPARIVELSPGTAPDQYEHPGKKDFKYTPSKDYGDEPVVYIVADHNFAYFRQELLRHNFETIVIDEAHQFKNTETNRGSLWHDLHENAIKRNASFMYLSATPGSDIAELEYLYGLKLWAVDGFNDWLGVITGAVSPDDAKKLSEYRVKIGEWEKTKEPIVRKVNETYVGGEYDTLVYLFKNGLRVVGQSVIATDRQGKKHTLRTESETVAKLTALYLEENGYNPQKKYVTSLIDDELRDAKKAVTRDMPDIPAKLKEAMDNQGVTDASDIGTGSRNERQRGGRNKRSAFDFTLPPQHTEQIMREMKIGGFFMSRDILRNGVDFRQVEYKPTPEILANHDKRINLYQQIYRAYYKFASMNKRDGKKGGGIAQFIQADAKRALFNMRLVGSIAEAKAAVARGEKVVLSLENVNEVTTTGGNLFAAIDSINSLQIDKIGDNTYSEPTKIPEVAVVKAEMLETLEELGPLPSPIEMLKNEFGTKIGFITGEVKPEQRRDFRRQFQQGDLDVIVISGAGKTGISLHDITGDRRVQLIVSDYTWSATVFKQELGRVDRTGQKSSPIVSMMHMGNPGELKFLSSIANRMRGLGATSKGAGESTSTTLNENFEFGGPTDRYVMAETWMQLDNSLKSMFVSDYFWDKHNQSNPDYWSPKDNLKPTADAFRRFSMALQSIPIADAQEIWQQFMRIRDDSRGLDEATKVYLEERSTGEMLRTTDLRSNLKIHEVVANAGHKFGILTGVLTPYMSDVKAAVSKRESLVVDVGQWRRWITFRDNSTGEIYSGIEIKPRSIGDVARIFEQSLGGQWTPETAIRDLRSGDRITIRGDGGMEWELYLGKGGMRDGKIIIEGAKMRHRDVLMRNGAIYDARTTTWIVPEENILTFLQRFPIDNSSLKMATPGGATIAYGPRGERYDMKYRIVSLDDLIPSHRETFDPNPEYPAELQPRNRDAKAYRDQVYDIASNLDERALMPSYYLDTGPAVIGPDMVVENGNGRTIAMRIARRDYPKKWQQYQEKLIEQLPEYGLSEADMEGIKDPVVVRERVSDIDRVKFSQDAQAGQSARMSGLEKAFTDKDLISPDMIAKLSVLEGQTIEGALSSLANDEIVQNWLRQLPASERTEVIGSDGGLNTDGLERMKYGLFAYVYHGEPGKRIARRFIETSNPGLKALEAALFSTLAQMGKVESMARIGTRSADYAMADDIIKACDMLLRLRKTNQSVHDYINQMSLFDSELSPFQKQLLVYFDANSKNRIAIRNLINLYTNNIINVQQPPDQMILFGPPPTKAEIIDSLAEQLGMERISTPETKVEAPAPEPVRLEEPRPTIEEPQTEPEQISPQEVEAIRQPLGTAEDLSEAPVAEAAQTGWTQQVEPILARAEAALVKAANERKGTGKTKQLQELDMNLDPELTKNLRRYLGKVYTQLSDAKMGAIRHGEEKRDFALLNYSRKTGMDGIAEMVMPYQFWYSRSMANWALRAMKKPSIFANYARLKEFSERNSKRAGIPTRLREKIGIPAPFLPSWMGDTIYIDPMRQIFPFEQLSQPFEKLGQQQALVSNKFESALNQMVENGEITEAQADEARTKQQGPIFDRALAQAQSEADAEITNPMDFMFSMVGPSLPVGIAYNLARNKKDKISQLPVARMIQALTGAAGIGGTRGINIEAPFRKAAGLPEVDRYEDYRVDRMLANMVADGTASAEDARIAMIDRKGEVFDEAQRRVSKMGLWNYFGAPLGVDMFPEGEQETRALKAEYDKAREAWVAGDKEALTRFYDEFPEYQARMDSFKEPEDRLRRYIISEVWDQYNDLPSLTKKEVREGFGSDFTDGFINKETRSYDTISTDQLAAWAKTLGANAPSKVADSLKLPLKLSSNQLAKEMQDYYDERSRLFPGVDQYITQSVSNDQTDAYTKWKNAYLAEHPNIIPLATSDLSSIAGLPQDIQTYIYRYRAAKERLYPGVDDMGSYYFGLDKDSRKAFLAQYPQLADYWDWRRTQAAQYPKAAAYILSEDSLANAITTAGQLPKEVQSYVDQYMTQRQQMYPNVDLMQDEYFNLDTENRRAYLKQNPQLSDYWNWRKAMAAQYPKAAPYIMSDASLAGIIRDSMYYKVPDYVIQQYPDELYSEITSNIATGDELSEGAWLLLERMWKQMGSRGELETWAKNAFGIRLN